MKIIHQSVFETWQIENSSVQCICTSPPYWSLRKYDIPDVVIGGQADCDHKFGNIIPPRGKSNWDSFEKYRYDGKRGKKIEETGNINHGNFCQCGAWQGQYGLEPDFHLFIEHTRLWAKEAWRVIRDDGIMFLNLGDSYVGGGRGSDKKFGIGRDNLPESFKGDDLIKPKCKLLIPHRIAITLIDDGWICRNDLVWHKINAMPESVTDRFSKRYEYIFMFVKQDDYYFDLDAVRETHLVGGNRERSKTFIEQGVSDHILKSHPKGKNPGDVWQIATQPSGEKHYAMYPERLVERMVRCSTKHGDIVLDPFVGSGTTIKVAETLGRVGYGIDLGYAEIQKRRLAIIEPVLI